MVVAEERAGERVHDARAAELGARVCGRARRDDRAVGERVPGPVVVGDDHVEPELAGAGDLLDRRDAAVDGEHEVDAVRRERSIVSAARP